MAAETHSFIDIAALDPVREHFAAGDAVVILTVELDRVVWANGPGAILLGFSGVEAAIGAESGLSRATIRQIAATPGYPEIGTGRTIGVRLAAGMVSQTTMLSAAKLTLPGGEAAIMLVVPFAGGSRSAREIADRAISGFDAPGGYLALVDGAGGVLAATQGFGDLAVDVATLGRLATDVATEQDRLLKRIVDVGGRTLPVGFARLSDEPAMHLLITVDESPASDDEAATPAPSLEDVSETVPSAAVTVAAANDSNIAGELADHQVSASTEASPSPDEHPATADEVASGAAGNSEVDDGEDHIPDPTSLDNAADAPETATAEAVGFVTSSDAREPGTPGSHHDNWYFADAAGPTAAVGDAALLAHAPGRDAEGSRDQPPQASPIDIDRGSAPVRFVWRTDAQGRFSSISEEFVAAVGAPAADIVGKSFTDAANRLAFDPDGEIAGLLERRDTWSGRSVFWPIAGTDLKAPVDLAALPAYDRDRKFVGFRGFGVVRLADAVVDPLSIGMSLMADAEEPSDSAAATSNDQPVADEALRGVHETTEPPVVAAPSADPFKGEVPALAIAPKPQRRHSDKVIRLAEHRVPANDKGLTPLERNAFREIGEQLKRTSGVGDATGELGAEPRAESPPKGTAAETADTMATTPAQIAAVADIKSPPSDLDDSTIEADAAMASESAPDVMAGATPPTQEALSVRTVAATDAAEWHVTPPAIGPAPVGDAEPTGAVTDSADETASDVPAGDDAANAVQPSPSAALDEQPTSAGDEIIAASEASAGTEADVSESAGTLVLAAGSAGDSSETAAAAVDENIPTSIADDEAAVGVRTSRSLLDFAAPAEDTFEPETDEATASALEPAGMQPAIDIAPPAAPNQESTPTVAGNDDLPPPQEAQPPTPDPVVATPEPRDEAAAPKTPLPTEAPKGPPLKLAGFLPSAFAERTATEPRADTSILAQLPIPVLIHSGDTLHYANGAFFALTGYESVEQLAERGGLNALLSGPAEDRQEGDNRVMLRPREGDEFPVSAVLQSVPWLGRKALLLTLIRQPAVPPALDTGPSAQENEALARVAELRTILDTATDGVILIGNDGNVRSISRPAEALFGYDSDQVTGKPFTSLFAIESQRAARDYLAGLSDNGVASVLNDGREVIGRESQGRFIPLFMTIGRLPANSGYCAVLRDITQWKRAEEDLTQARAQAERTSSQKSDFLARVSHEIRTPLNAIIGFSELMLDEKFGPVANDRYRDYLRDINRSGNHVLDLVNDLLDISKIEAGQQDMDYEAVALNDALAETVALMQPQANRERVIIRSSFASKLPEVVADLRSVRQIALNILSNAVRYTQAGGQVIVSTAYEPNGEVVMRVRDTGIGMSQAEIEQALKPFKQINPLKRARGDGTGLGLPLTKAMVEANRAKFAIYSTPGEGTLVEVAFPSTRVLAE